MGFWMKGRKNLPGKQGGTEWPPKVTALVPCYNAAEFIDRTLDSLAAQTWPDLEILIGDDCSADSTLSIVQRFAANQSNVRLVTRESNLGWLRNSNDLMSQAQGELMFFAFHDDLVAPTYVERLVSALRDRPNAIMAFSDVEVTEIDGSCSVCAFTSLTNVTGAVKRAVAFLYGRQDWWVPNRGLFYAEAFHRIGGIKPNDCGEYSADHTWLLHMALLGDFVRVPEVLCWKFYKNGSLSKRWTHTPAEYAAVRKAALTEIWHSELPLWQKLLVISIEGTRSALRKARFTRKRKSHP
jgi:glycosyltransferase involved in cell wall biosynthesis